MSENGHPHEADPDPATSGSEESDWSPSAADPAAPGATDGSRGELRQRKLSVGDYLALATPGNLLKLGNELLDQAANPYGTRSRRRRRRRKDTG
jgi:hypothetical protein